MPASRPALELVVACSEDDVIGRGNRLPWHLPDDLRRTNVPFGFSDT